MYISATIDLLISLLYFSYERGNSQLTTLALGSTQIVYRTQHATTAMTCIELGNA